MHHDPEITSYLFEHARDIILVIDADDGQILDANRAAEAAYGYTRVGAPLARKILDLRAEPEGFADRMRPAGEAGSMSKRCTAGAMARRSPSRSARQRHDVGAAVPVQHHPGHHRAKALRGGARGAAGRHAARAPAPR
ncbi:MAG: PAS domain-containing protein [Myxococcales bacterium]|nr:PAS domain-containing protein [Myxococcales bacterium]